MKDNHTTPETGKTAPESLPKRGWQTPKIEEVDYTETQSSVNVHVGIDLGFYS